MLGMLIEGPKQATEHMCEQKAEFRGDFHSLKGFAKMPLKAQFDRFIERDTQHRIIGFEAMDVFAENYILFRRQAGAPGLFN